MNKARVLAESLHLKTNFFFPVDNRPFAAGGHMVQNPKYWRAKECDKTLLGNVNTLF